MPTRTVTMRGRRVAEHQAQDQDRRRVGDARRHGQDEGQDRDRPGDGGADQECVTAQAGGRAERRRHAHPGAEHHDGHAETGPRRDAEREGIGQRIAEERLHLQAGDPQGGAGEHRRQGARQPNRLHHDRGSRIRRRGPGEHADHDGDRHVRRAQRQRQHERGDEERDQTSQHQQLADGVPSGGLEPRRAAARPHESRRRVHGGPQRAGTGRYHWNACSRARSGWKIFTRSARTRSGCDTARDQ